MSASISGSVRWKMARGKEVDRASSVRTCSRKMLQCSFQLRPPMWARAAVAANNKPINTAGIELVQGKAVSLAQTLL